jgi:riboflavin synthase
MFSGIIEGLGEVKNLSRRGNLSLLEVEARNIPQDIRVGDSVAVNGACLTVVNVRPDILSFEVMPETLRLTDLGSLHSGEKVNLEYALKAGQRISGHFVTGHVDCQGMIRRKSHVRGNLAFEIAVAAEFSKYCLAKGSIAVDGISLTIAEKRPASFSVYIIPHTLKNTTLGFKGPSDRVNIEFDILAKSACAK